MRTIEVAGPIGAGKTSLVAPLREHVARDGRPVLTVDDAMTILDPAPTPWARWRAAARFAGRHPSLLAMAGRSLLRAPIAGWHRRRIMLLVIKLGMRLELLRTRLPPEATVILDEGWLHRTLNLYAWRTDEVPDAELEAYLDRAPLSDLVVYVDAASEVVRSRATARGLPKRLEGRTPDEADAFLARGERILSRAVASLRAVPRGVQLVHVKNDHSPMDLPSALDRAFAAHREARAPLHRQVWPSVPRIDRLAARRGRRTNLLDADAARRAALVAGIRRPVVADATLSPGGRGSVRAVRDADGRHWLVKRYKPTLHDADIAVEQAVLRRLAELRLPAARPYPAAPGSSPITVDGQRYAVYEMAAGYAHPHERLYTPSDGRRLDRLAGELLAALHEGLRGYEPPSAAENGFTSLGGPRVRPVEWFTRRLAVSGGGPSPPAPAGDLAWMSEELSRLDRVLDAADPARTVIHGDYGPYNLLIRAGREPIVIDWELARIDWRLSDLATAIPRFAARRVGWDHGAARRFLAAYRRRSSIEPAELALLPLVAEYLGLRRAVVCLERFRDTGEERWRTEMRDRLRLARRLVAGDHPLVRLVEG